MQKDQNETEFYDEEMPDVDMSMEPAQPDESWDFWGYQVDNALTNLFERMHTMEGIFQGEQEARTESLQQLKADFERWSEKFLCTEHWNVIQAKFTQVGSEISSVMQNQQSSLRNLTREEIGSASHFSESCVTEINEKVDHVVEASQKLLWRKFINGMGDLESRIIAHIQSKFSPIKALSEGTHENLHDMGVRLVKLEANAVRLAEQSSGTQEVNLAVGALEEKILALQVAEKLRHGKFPSQMREEVIKRVQHMNFMDHFLSDFDEQLEKVPKMPNSIGFAMVLN